MDIQAATPSPATTMAPSHLWSSGHEFSFHDIIDALNPLQHLPIVSTIYRHLTGDTIGNAARVVGDALYSGPIGLAVSLYNAHLVNKTGSDLGDHVLALVDKELTPSPPATATQPMPASPTAQAQFTALAAPINASSATDAPPSDATLANDASSALSSTKPVDLPYFPTSGAGIAMPLVRKGFAIDTSPSGIYAMRARVHSDSGIPLQMPNGVSLANQPSPDNGVLTGADFAQKMRDGMAKYQAMLAQQATRQH